MIGEKSVYALKMLYGCVYYYDDYSGMFRCLLYTTVWIQYFSLSPDRVVWNTDGTIKIEKKIVDSSFIDGNNPECRCHLYL